MKRSLLMMPLMLLVCATAAWGFPMSPNAEAIQDMPYRYFSSDSQLQLGGLTIDADKYKANGLLPSVHDGIVAWEDGRNGETAIWGWDIATSAATAAADGEFIISEMFDGTGYQEGNPFVGVGSTGTPIAVYDGDVAGGDPRDAFTSNSSNTYATTPGTSMAQRSAVFTLANPHGVTGFVAWIDQRHEVGANTNTDIYVQQVDPTTGANIAVAEQRLTASFDTNEREGLAASKGKLVWAEHRLENVGGLSTTETWGIRGYDLNAGTPFDVHLNTTVIGGAAAKEVCDPDISGDLVVWTQIDGSYNLPYDRGETADGTALTGVETITGTNIYLKVWNDVGAPIAITVSNRAAHAAVSMDDDLGNFVVWQEYVGDKIFYKGSDEDDDIDDNGKWDFQWDIYCREVVITGGVVTLGDTFIVNGAGLGQAGRQLFPDIDGLDVVWQTQDAEYDANLGIIAGEKEIFVVGPTPEPMTMGLLLAGVPVLLARKRRRASRKNNA